MTVKEILVKYLKLIGADGLCNPENECGCDIDDLCPCDSYCLDCIPAKRIKNNEEVGDFYYIELENNNN